MDRYSDNYYYRKCYLEKQQVPTQSVMKDRMRPPLANVYFKSMPPKIQVLAGLAPPLKGGVAEWYTPPEEMLAGRAVLKPIKIQYLNRMSYEGLLEIGEQIRERFFKSMLREMQHALRDSDKKWKQTVLETNRKQYEIDAKQQILANSRTIRKAVNEFGTLCRTSITELENMIFDAAISEITRIREEVFHGMKEHYEKLVKYQATELYDEYNAKLNGKKEKMKARFIEKVESLHKDTGNLIHDLNVEKHIIIEKLRHALECQNLACQMYVAMKEREENIKEMETTKKEHAKKIRQYKEQMANQEYEIKLNVEQQLKRQEFNRIWKKKVCHVVQQFQLFVKYCLKTLPQHAEFFINMERLMMLQLNDAVEDPRAESIIESETEFNTPVPNAHPFYLFCDRNFKPLVENDLCPKHCTSSASHIPVTVINKRFIYSACDKFDMFSEKLVQFLAGNKGDDVQFEDDHDYDANVPVKHRSSMDLKELKLQSSIMQILQEELPNIRKLPVECPCCKITYCFCSPLHASELKLIGSPSSSVRSKVSGAKSGAKPEKTSGLSGKPSIDPKKGTIGSEERLEMRKAAVKLYREPQFESYMQYVAPRRCKCEKVAKKHLEDHLPLYMRLMSPFEPPQLPQYEPCKIETIRRLVKKARGIRTPPPPEVVESRTRDIATQYSDHEFELLCTCVSEDALSKIFDVLMRGSKVFSSKTNITRGSLLATDSHSFLTKTASTFATQRALSLRQLIGTAPVLEELFNKRDCK